MATEPLLPPWTEREPAPPPSLEGWAAVAPRRLGRELVRRTLPWLLGSVVLALAVGFGFGSSEQDLAQIPLPAVAQDPGDREIERLSRTLAAQAPRGVRVEVDTIANRLYLRQGTTLLHEAVCSTGTGGLLEEPGSGRRWVFETPHGVHRVLDKKKKPVWNKPDWAFVEEGKPIPTDPKERLDPYSLGDYALYLGGGYLIHGTLYQRLLGRSVTHGCIRLGDEDLETVFRQTPLGARVYIY